MAAEEFGERMDYDVGAVVERPHRYGVASVLSTISGTFALRAIFAMASMSGMLPPGLAIDSMKIALVFGDTAFSNVDDIVGVGPLYVPAEIL